MYTLIRTLAVLSLMFGGASIALAEENSPESTATATTVASTSTMSKVTFPIAELGNCSSRETCKAYCEQDANKSACLAYAQKVGLMSKEKVAAAKMVISKKGPGNCSSKDSCIAYCSDSSHRDECLSFAQEHKLISDEKVSLIKKISAGEGPGACTSAESCKAYCTDPSHRDECRSFAEENGLKPKMGSTSPMMKRMGSSTPGMMNDDRPRIGSTTRDVVKGILASTTPGRERGEALREKFGSSTPGIMKGEGERRMGSSTGMPPKDGMMNGTVKPINSDAKHPRPPKEKESGSGDNLGATLLKGFLSLIGL